MTDDALSNFNEECNDLISKIEEMVIAKNTKLNILSTCLSMIECRISFSTGVKKEDWIEYKSDLWDEVYKNHDQMYNLSK